LEALCQRAFPERTAQQIESIQPLSSRQHEMLSFDLRWQFKANEYVDPLIVRRYVSTLSWWRPDDHGKAQREITVMRWLQQKGLPVSRVYAREFSTLGDVVLYQRLEGQDWSAQGRPFPEIVRQQAEPLAILLAQIHSLPPPPEVQAVVPAVSLPASLANLTAMAIQINNAELIDAVNRAMARAYDVLEGEPVLLHGDYHFSNVLLSGDRITGIVDWEYCALGDPRWDVANAYMQMVDFDAAEAAGIFLEAYFHHSGRRFMGPPLYNVVAPLQQWVMSEWLLAENSAGRTRTFGLAEDLMALRDVHHRRAQHALALLEE
jgi:aminoglycoside phosphotransferase (APT) family kinase protein